MVDRRNTLIRALHDVGAAGWFGGALMGAVGVNGAANDVADIGDRARVAAAGWARWSPVNAALIGIHLVGGAGLVITHRDRVSGQAGVTANTIAKTAITAAAVGATAYSGVLGNQVASAGRVAAEGGTKPHSDTPPQVAQAQQRLRVLQWAIPVLTGAIVVLGAQQGEQQRPGERIAGSAKHWASTLTP